MARNCNCENDIEILPQASLNKKLKLMRKVIKYFLTKLLGREVFSSMIPRAKNIF